MISCIDLCRNLKHVCGEEIRTVEALCMDVCGDRTAGMMLHRLMLWWMRTSNAEGWVYKSHRDWWGELRIKANELPKLNGLLEYVGVVRAVKRAAGSPTSHYRLDVGRFLERLAKVLNQSVEKILNLLVKNPFEGTGEASQNGFSGSEGEPKKSITTDSNDLQHNAVVVDEDEATTEESLNEPNKTLTPSPSPSWRGENERQGEEIPAEVRKLLWTMQEDELAKLVEKQGSDYAVAAARYALGSEHIENPAAFARWAMQTGRLRVDPHPPAPDDEETEEYPAVKKPVQIIGKNMQKRSPRRGETGIESLNDGMRYITGKYADFIKH